MRSLLFALVSFVLIISCQQGKPQEKAVERDLSITPVNAYSDMFFDSLRLEKFILNTHADDTLAGLLRDFYNVRNYQFAWFEKEGMNEQAKSFANLLNYYMNNSHDSSVFNPMIKSLEDSVSETGLTPELNDSTRVQYEL